jgi:uncharacterized protein with FMN-binding domain
MKKIVFGFLATAAGLVALFSYHTSLDSSIPVATTAPVDPTNSTGAPAAAGSTGERTSTLNDGTYTGQSASTPYGPVQVQLTIGGGKIARVEVPQYPDTTRHDLAINQRAIPRLVSETMTAQSADIDMVSGATYTSDGYTRSLQSAIDQALK